MNILTAERMELFLSFLIPFLIATILYLSLKEEPPYPTVSFLIKTTLIAIVIDWIIILPLYFLIILFLFYSVFFLKTFSLFKEKDIIERRENNLTPIDKSIPLKFIFEESTQSRISWQNYWYFILAGTFIYIIVIDDTYIVLYFILYIILIETQDIINQRFYKGSWKVTISQKELRWETPPFETSYQVDIKEIKSLKKIKDKNFKGFSHSSYYVLETINQEIRVDTALEIDMEEFKSALREVGVKVEV